MIDNFSIKASLGHQNASSAINHFAILNICSMP